VTLDYFLYKFNIYTYWFVLVANDTGHDAFIKFFHNMSELM